MPIASPRLAVRTRAAPIAELSSVVAYNSSPQLPKSSGDTRHSTQLTKKKSYASLHSSALLHSRKSSPSKIPSAPHERSLELLRTVLATAQLLGSELEPSQAVKAAAQPIEPAARAPWSLTLDEQRIAFIETLRQLQHPHADVIGSLNLLLCNRAAIGLLGPNSAADYCCAMQRAACINAAMPIDIVDLTWSAAACSLSSSFGSDESATTLGAEDVERFDSGEAIDQVEQTIQGLKLGLVEMWANSGLWRGVSARSRDDSSDRRRRSSAAHSVHTVVADEPRPAIVEVKPAAIADHMGTCWPLDEATKEVASSWGRFYADLGGVRVPTRFRVPRHSLAMLATEQLMMRNDKIICPLKNRLQEANPRRQRFEDFISATGTIPVQMPPTKLRRSPLRDSVVF
ncbi:hypothetical protein IW152_000552 [Coemansia sp. BCRC 34962]|nr:hypothetical protein IW152_000552 [Coemansia sp. BCRC 34962]